MLYLWDELTAVKGSEWILGSESAIKMPAAHLGLKWHPQEEKRELGANTNQRSCKVSCLGLG
jgi:hypothetical protein